MLDWWLVPKEGVEPNQQHEKRKRQVTKLLSAPNADLNWNTFIEQVCEELCVVGIAPIEVKTLRAREIDDINDSTVDAPRHALFPFDGSSLQHVMDWNGSPTAPRYVQTLPDGRVITFTNSEIIPMRYGSRVVTPDGLSPMDVAYQDIERFLETGAFAGRTASNANAKKALFLKNATTEQINDLRAYWRNEIEGTGALAIIGGEDAQTLELGLVTDANLFLNFQEFLITVIAAAFGVDALKANVIAGVNRSTGDNLSQATDEGAVKPFADMIAQYVNQYVLPLYQLGDVYEFRFIYTSISDQKSIAVLSQVELQDDSVTINEARFRQGRPPLLHPVTGEDIGNMTLSAYRAALKVPGFLSKGLKALEDHAKTLERQAKLQEAKLTQGTQPNDGSGDFADGENSNNTSNDPNARGGNGVYSAPKPKEKAMNQRSDPSMETT